MELLAVVGSSKKNGFIVTLFTLCLCLSVPIFSHRTTDSSSERNGNELPFCKPSSDNHQSRSILVVSTLDGHITALDAVEGSVVWSRDTEPGALLASTISNHEYTNEGKWSRLVPSLNGDLFTFDGESMEAVPISADSLLSNSLKMSDDTVIAGGKEINIYGIKRDTGELVYKCGIDKCKHLDDVIQNSNDGILLVRRMTRTVRAVSVNSGTEKWNYSVGQHEVKFAVSSKEEGCHTQAEDSNSGDGNFEKEADHSKNDVSHLTVRFKSSEGEIYMFKKNFTLDLMWQYKFSSPIVNAWNVSGQQVRAFDLFECQYNPIASNKEESEVKHQPVLYVGLYNQQLYVVQSKQSVESLSYEWRAFGVELQSAPPKVTWKPYIITSHSRTPIILGRLPSNGDAVISRIKGEGENTALVMSHNGVEYPFDNGLYLFPSQNVNAQASKTVELIEDESIEQIIVSLWYWWREVLVISMTFAVALNIFVVKIYRLRRKCLQETKHEVVIELVANDSCMTPKELNTQNSNSSSQMATPPAEFVSRYMTDFEPLEILGKGGFGVVFCARNKIDDCEYAIKRISIPNNQDSKERILREVKTLAKLDHVGIVRYYNSWLECPPADWQSTMDQNMNTGNLLTPTASLTSEDVLQMYRNRTNNRGDGFSDYISKMPNELSSNLLNNGYDSSDFGLNIRNRKKNCDRCSDVRRLPEKSMESDSESVLPRREEPSGGSFIVFEGTNTKPTNNDDVKFQLSDCKESSKGQTIDLVTNSAKDLCKYNKPLVSTVISDKEPTESEVVKFPPWAQPTKTLLYIQMQLCRKDSLKDWLSENNETRNNDEVLNIFYQILSAVEYVHDQGLMHRDLKPSNIFFALDGTVKVGDFGLVTNMATNQRTEEKETEKDSGLGSTSSKHTHQVGTTLYMSPEQIAGEMYDHKVDIFSLGLVFFELLVPFTTSMERIKTMNDARALRFSPSFITESPSAHDLVKQMLEHVPDRRPSASEILTHPLLEDCQLRSDRCRRGIRIRSTSRTFSVSSSGSGQGSSGNDAERNSFKMNDESGDR